MLIIHAHHPRPRSSSVLSRVALGTHTRAYVIMFTFCGLWFLRRSSVSSGNAFLRKRKSTNAATTKSATNCTGGRENTRTTVRERSGFSEKRTSEKKRRERNRPFLRRVSLHKSNSSEFPFPIGLFSHTHTTHQINENRKPKNVKRKTKNEKSHFTTSAQTIG